jgi:hypothetical protein
MDALLAGAHHTYGHNDSWRILPTWKSALDAPGATQLGLLKKIFMARNEWWYLVPDQSIFASGANTSGRELNLAAHHKDGRWLMIYLASKASFAVDLKNVGRANQVKASWIDPRDAHVVSIGTFATSGEQAFSTPDGWEDALLIVEASAS